MCLSYQLLPGRRWAQPVSIQLLQPANLKASPDPTHTSTPLPPGAPRPTRVLHASTVFTNTPHFLPPPLVSHMATFIPVHLTEHPHT